MDLSDYKRMDTNILLGIVNEKLRLECDNLDDLVATFNFSKHDLDQKMAQIGYHYDPLTNQFKPL